MIESKNDLAVKIQSAWRGRQTRKELKRRNMGALQIQRFARGMLCRFHFSHLLIKQREHRLQHNEHQKRMREIASKETDLKLLANISSDMYIHFDKLKKANCAKIIQRLWLKKKSKTPRESSQKSDISHQNSSTANFLNKPSENPLHGKLKSYIFEKDRSRTACASNTADCSENSNPLGLSQLYQRIKMECQKKTQLNDMKRSAGARHKYRELLEMQQKAKVYQQEYEELLPHLTRTKEERSKSLHSLKDHYSFFSQLQDLDNADQFLSKDMGLYVCDNEDEFLQKVEDSITNHLVALDTFSSEKWDTIYVPLLGKSSVLRQNKFVDPVEESLLWVTYAQTTNQANHKNRQLQKDILSKLRDPKREIGYFVGKYNEENIRIQKLSKLVQESLWRELRLKFQMISENNRSTPNKKSKIHAIILIQSAIRSYLARKTVAVLKDQKKMLSAVQTFMKEISSLKHVDDANAFELLLHRNVSNISSRRDSLRFHNGSKRSTEVVDQSRSLFVENPHKLYSGMIKQDQIQIDGNMLSTLFTPTADLKSHVITRNSTSNFRRSAKGKVDFVESEKRPSDTLPCSVTSDSNTASISTPLRTGPHGSTQNTPHETDRTSTVDDSSGLLSPFLEMPTDNHDSYGGYISPPSQSHTLSRSLSASFGKVVFVDEKEDDVEHYEKIISRLDYEPSPLSQLIDQALIADEKNYDKEAAQQWIVRFSSQVDSVSLFRWLSSRFSEVDVEVMATLLLELWHDTTGQILESDLYCYTNCCTMLRFMAAAQPSGKVSILSLHNVFLQNRRK